MDRKYFFTLIAKGFIRLFVSFILLDIYSSSEVVIALSLILLISAIDKFLDAIDEY